MIGVQVLQGYRCYRGTGVTGVQVLQGYRCDWGTGVTGVQVLLGYRYSCGALVGMRNSSVANRKHAFITS